MTRKQISLYMTITSAAIIATPGRLAYGIILSIELCLLMVLGTLFRFLLKKFNIKLLEPCIMCAFIVFFTIVFKCILIFLDSEAALTLGFVLYLPSISTFTSVFLFDEKNLSLKEEIFLSLEPALVFSCYTILVSFLRDIFGYGTITFIGIGKIVEKVIFKSGKISWLSFFATVPGALVISGLALSFILTFEKRMRIVEKIYDGEKND